MNKFFKNNSLDFNKPPSKTRVIVAMSGGVDSSVVAAMLKNEGYDVIGITLQLYDHGKSINKKGACCAGKDIKDAQRIAEQIGIPHYVFDYEKEFKKNVIDDFARSYVNGETPIPCIKCNETVKFNDLLNAAKQMNSDCLATGHYVRRKLGLHGVELHRALNEKKDQSYFLFSTQKKQLDFLRFPLGEIKSKDETRNLAKKYKLKVADKPDSQDICFITQGNYSDLIKKLHPNSNREGDIINEKGEVLGKHKGLINYTIGQRKGIGIGGGMPYYVLKINIKDNNLTVGSKKSLKRKSFYIKNINWLDNKSFLNPSDNSWKFKIKIRSSQPYEEAFVFPITEKSARVEFKELNSEAISPGQACVFYSLESNRVFGGGWIRKEEN